MKSLPDGSITCYDKGTYYTGDKTIKGSCIHGVISTEEAGIDKNVKFKVNFP